MSQKLLDQVISAYQAQLKAYPKDFADPGYIQGLITQELGVIKKLGKFTISLLLLNVLAFTCVQHMQFKIPFFGQDLTLFPAFPEAICLLLGLNLFAFSITNLDLMLFVRLRYAYVRAVLGTDLVNITTAHLKGSNIWLDIISPWLIATLPTGWQKRFLKAIASVMLVFIISIYIVSGVSLISLFIFGLRTSPFSWVWAFVISFMGLVMGLLGLVLFIGVHFIPFNFVPSSTLKIGSAGRVG